MEALLSYHRTAKHAIAGPAGDLPWNRLSFYFGHTKKKEHKKKRPFTRKLWNAVTLRFDKRQFEANFDEAFCHQSIHRCRVVIWFMLVLVVVHYILEFTFSDPPQNQFFSDTYKVRKPPVWAHALILAMVLIYTGYMFLMSRSQRFFFTRAMHALMVSTIFVVGYGLLAITILTKDISPPSTFIVFFCGIYISPPSKFPIVTVMCTSILASLLAYLLSSGMLTAHEKLSHLFLLLLADFLGMVVLSQIETTLRHEFMQIHNTKVEFRDLIQEQAHWEVLISTILPIPVAKALRENVASVAARYRDVTILFAEIVDFESQIGIKLSPDETVIFLNRIFMIFDRLIDKHKLEKVKTIGPTIVIAGGLNVPMEDHLTEMVELAIDMMLEMERLNKRIPMKVNLRIGLNSGELVAGVIGKTRLCYDVWGDTVNTASRMMTHSVAGKIHVPFSLCGRIYTQYVIEDRGEIEVKGKGRMRTAYVVQRRATNNTALSLHYLPPLFTTIERKFKHLSMGAEMQTKDQAPEDPFRRSNPGLALPAPPRSPPAMLLRKPAASATVVQTDSPGRRHHIKVSPAQPAQYNRTTWQEQLDHLLSTNIAGAANADNNNDSSVVVDRDFFSKWTLRYHHASLESQFHQYRSVVNSRDFSFTVFAGLVLNCAFGLIDYLIAPRTLFLSHLIVPRFAVVVPTFVIAMFVAQIGKHRLGRGMHWMGVFLAAASAAAVLANTVLGLDHAMYRAYFIAEYALVIMYAFLFVHVRFLYFVTLYIGLVLGYAIVVIVVGGEMVGTLRWGLFLFLALGGVATVSSYQTEQLIRTEWILVSMGERSKRKREKQKETVEDLLSNILPKKVVMRLKGGYVGTFAEDFQNCTVMFVDVCDFCDICNTLTPSELVDTLDAIFSGFDNILAQYPTLEKVKTIGDCYMVVGGALDKSPDHAQQIVNCGLDMIRMMKGMSIKQNGVLKPLSIRIGVHSGLVHAGLIGWTKMIYDMWGETVDIAKMCEAQGIPDYVQITHATFNQIRNFDFRSEPSTPIVVRPDKKIDTVIISAKNFRKDMDNYV